MSVARAFFVIVASATGFAVAGAVIGLLLAWLAPAYYRGVFSQGSRPDFDPVAVGFGLGLTQGLICGVLAGAVVVLAVAWHTSRTTRAERRESAAVTGITEGPQS